MSTLLKVIFYVSTLFLILAKISYKHPKYQKSTIFLEGNLENGFTENWRRESVLAEFPQCAVWKLLKFTLTVFWQKFRETNVFTKEITK